MSKKTLPDSIGSVTISSRAPLYMLHTVGSEISAGTVPSGRKIWIYEAGPYTVMEFKTKKASAQVFKRMTGYDIEKAPKFDSRKDCKCKRPVPIVTLNRRNLRRSNYMRYLSCSKCGGYLKGFSASARRGEYD